MTLRSRLSSAVVLLAIGIAMLFTFMMVADELRNVDLNYCPAVGNANCTYPYPLFGTMHIWDAWVFDFFMIVISNIFIGIGLVSLGMVIQELKE